MSHSQLKESVLSLDNSLGVNKQTFDVVYADCKAAFGTEAAQILFNAIEVDEDGMYYFPKEGDAEKVWKRMNKYVKMTQSAKKLPLIEPFPV